MTRLFLVLLVLTCARLLIAAPARAGESPEPGVVCSELPCSVNRNCSSTGVACDPDDRACTERARSRNLEVKCEQRCTSGQRLVYCPLDAGRSDSNVVWYLLVFASGFAVFGAGIAWMLLRKRA